MTHATVIGLPSKGKPGYSEVFHAFDTFEAAKLWAEKHSTEFKWLRVCEWLDSDSD